MRLSHDLEDIIAVIDGNTRLFEQIQQAEEEVRRYLKEQFDELLKNSLFEETVSGFLVAAGEAAQRTERVIALISGVKR